MDVLFCTSESAPFAASGGLAEVSSALPKVLNQQNIHCSVVMPLYNNIPQHIRDKMDFLTNFYVPLAWRSVYCGIFKYDFDGVTYYFIDNEYYFKRDSLYGYYDDGERFAFFSRAVLEMLVHINYKPNIIHCNDWQTALVPVYYSLIYSDFSLYAGIKNIFTIHNIQYQGKYGLEIIENVIGIPEEDFSVLEFDNCANFMKGAIETADIITTVSPTYAKEILNPWFSHGLDPILREKKYKLYGVLNGIDTSVYNPQTDSLIYKNYSEFNLEGKLTNKKLLKERLCLEDGERTPLIAMITRLVDHKGIELVINVFERLMIEEKVQFIILGSGKSEFESFFTQMQNKYRGRVSMCYGFVPELSHKIYAASDIFLMPSKSEPCGLSQMIALRYGSIPIVRETGGLLDSIKDSEDGIGNGFTFRNYTSEDMMAAIKRALCGYLNKEGWEILVSRAMRCDNSFITSATRYIDLYKILIDDQK